MKDNKGKVGAPKVVAVASAKGGVGKSLIAANIGVFLATLSRRVVLVDASFGASNLHTMVGVPKPRGGLADVLRELGRPLADVLEATSVPGLQLASGHWDPPWAADPRPDHVERLAGELHRIDADYVILDLASGTSAAALDLAEAADQVMLVATPEPTSVELAYRWLITFVLRRVLRAPHGEELRALVREQFATPIPAPVDLYRAARAASDDLAEVVADCIDHFHPALVVNCARSKADIDLGLALTAAIRRRLGVPVHCLGHLEYDDAVWVSLRRRRPLLIEHPDARVSKCIEKVTRRLMASPTLPHFAELETEPSHYGLLEIDPGATDEEIRRSMRRLRSVYSADSLVVGGLYDGAELEALLRKLEAAYDELMDPLRRKEYDQHLFPDGVPDTSVAFIPRLSTVAPPPEERPSMPALGPDTEYTGQLLRQVREAKGLDLREIAEHTKIGMAYLDAIENDVFGKLPARVYVRGFLTEYAKMLGLDTERVVESYLRRLRQSSAV